MQCFYCSLNEGSGLGWFGTHWVSLIKQQAPETLWSTEDIVDTGLLVITLSTDQSSDAHVRGIKTTEAAVQLGPEYMKYNITSR